MVVSRHCVRFDHSGCIDIGQWFIQSAGKVTPVDGELFYGDFPIEHFTLVIAVFSFTGVNIGESIYYSYFCMDKGYADHIGETETAEGIARAKSWLRVMHTDVWLTLVLLTLVTIPFYILGASVLHATGDVFRNTVDHDYPRCSNLCPDRTAGGWVHPVPA